MNLTAPQLRTLIEEEMERRDLNPCAVARRCENPDPEKGLGIARNACYAAMKAEGQERVGTLLRMARALGFATERTYRLNNLGIVERRRIHDNDNLPDE